MTTAYRSSAARISGSVTNGLRGSYTERYVIADADAQLDWENLVTADGLPTLGSLSADELYAVGQIRVEQSRAEDAYEATVTWQANPLGFAPEIRVFSSHIQEVVSEDQEAASENEPRRPEDEGGLRSKIICNSAGDLYDPPISENRARARLEITRYQQDPEHKKNNTSPVFQRDNIASYVDHANAVAFLEFPANTVYCVDVHAELLLDPFHHYRVTGIFEIDDKTWKRRILDAGPRYRVDGALREFRSDNQVIFSRGGLLDGDGGKLDVTSGNVTGHFREFQTIPRADLYGLKLVDRE